ncbi:MAG: hypothetical protein JJU29_15630 [Verrucomicrobia bacterium]|nr:hypothetical protein [Verrucomicrobiota bacterium]MCH8513454.1 hypothetical protein [Kiritimatiellia bacterium]
MTTRSAPLIPRPLTPEAFAPYGEVLRRDPEGELFQPLHTEGQSRGWRVALLDCRPGPVRRVHRHPDSEECFALLQGRACIAVAAPDTPEEIQLFFLEEPICIRRNVWHEVVSREQARIFIAENAEISGEPLFLDPPIAWRDPRMGP